MSQNERCQQINTRVKFSENRLICYVLVRFLPTMQEKDLFKRTFKYYKSKCPPPTFEEVIDCDEINEHEIRVRSIAKSSNSNEFRIRGLLPSNQWKIYELKKPPGLIFIRNPFTKHGQRYWIARCLQDYPKAPHAVNLDKKYFNENVISDWWKSFQEIDEKENAKEKMRLKNGMRWATLGYHHDWDTKVYAEDKRHRFPDDLAKLNEYFADVLGLGKYSAEAAIVNFYPLGTTLAGHTDHSEKNLDAPLFSISFGQTAIFLLGGKTREEKPSALFLKSGDIVVMSRESRLSYHAVPKILQTDVSWLNETINDDSTHANNEHGNDSIETENVTGKKRRLTISENNEHYDDAFSEEIWRYVVEKERWKPFADYISDCRINMNVRQVLDHGEQTLNP